MTFPTKYLQASKFEVEQKAKTELTTYGENDHVNKRGDPHRWEIMFTTRKHDDRGVREIGAYLRKLRGRYNTFKLPCPLKYYSNKETFNVSLAAFAGEDSLFVNGLDLNVSEALFVGDFVNFEGHDKTYEITETTASSGTGSATLKIHPKLRANVSFNSSVTKGVFTVRMASDNFSQKFDASSGLYSILIKAREAT